MTLSVISKTIKIASGSLCFELNSGGRTDSKYYWFIANSRVEKGRNVGIILGRL